MAKYSEPNRADTGAALPCSRVWKGRRAQGTSRRSPLSIYPPNESPGVEKLMMENFLRPKLNCWFNAASHRNDTWASHKKKMMTGSRGWWRVVQWVNWEPKRTGTYCREMKPFCFFLKALQRWHSVEPAQSASSTCGTISPLKSRMNRPNCSTCTMRLAGLLIKAFFCIEQMSSSHTAWTITSPSVIDQCLTWLQRHSRTGR